VRPTQAAGRGTGPIRLTERDRRILRFCAEHRFVLAPQVAMLLGAIGTDAAKRRLAALHRAGYLARERRYVAEPFAYSVTRAGLGMAGSALGPPRDLDPAMYAHDVGVAWLGAAAHRGAFGELSEIACERRMRSEDARGDRDGPPHGLRCAGAGGRGLHYPDLAVVTASGRRVAFELERHVKGVTRRERILAAYACDPRVDAVVYLVATEADRTALIRSAHRVGLDDRLHVQRFAWSDGREPGTSRERPHGRAPGARARPRPHAPARPPGRPAARPAGRTALER
jgi:hypothetical protein